MDPVRNPFAPGAGTTPPELAGRSAIIADADIALQRRLLGKSAKSVMLLGLRGVGKTVLLNRIHAVAKERGYETAFIESPEDASLAKMLIPHLHQALRRFSMKEQARSAAHRALRALRSFASILKIEYGDASISVDPEPGAADSGNMEFDLVDLFGRVGEAAGSAGAGWALLIDEVQYLDTADLSALIVALHRVNQQGLPIAFFGAGLPQIAALAGDAKSYSERLFDFPVIGALDPGPARAAIAQPIHGEGEAIDTDALEAIVVATHGYPYFLQEWGFQAWNAADRSPIDLSDVDQATHDALRRLDEGFFRVRFDRLTPKEREYVLAMASLGEGPYRSADVAAKLGENIQTLGPRRAAIIRKGMIYSPSHGDIAFTVPLFEQFLRRLFGSDLARPGTA
jgi:hypothetical protein